MYVSSCACMSLNVRMKGAYQHNLPASRHTLTPYVIPECLKGRDPGCAWEGKH